MGWKGKWASVGKFWTTVARAGKAEIFGRYGKKSDPTDKREISEKSVKIGR
jgi:hypothetical protein